jgi:hypothetical protein
MVSNRYVGPRAEQHSEDKSPAMFDLELSGTLFHEHWWLSAVTGGDYNEVTVRAGQRVIGRMPFVIRRQAGFKVVRMPPFSHVLGPVVEARAGKPQSQILHRLSTIRALLDQLPPFDYFKQALGSSIIDGLAFQDRGFQVSPQYNFEIDCRRDPKMLWDDMHFKARQHIRRAEEKFSVGTIDNPDEFVRFYLSSLQKQGRTNSLDLRPFPTLFEACNIRDCGEILCARGTDGLPVAMVYLVWGHGTMYYLLSSRAGIAGDNGSINLLIWDAMQRAHDRGLSLDLDGISDSGTARFLSSFGGRMTTRLIVRRTGFLYGTLQYAKRRLVGGVGDKTIAFT